MTLEMNFTSDVVIGLEIHISILTESKLFCSCKNSAQLDENVKPNSSVCSVCLGHPGSKPLVNEKAIEYALKLCKAAKCKISPEVIFSRKSYFYPDLAKNYQITQYEIPIGNEGEVELPSGKKIGLVRIHIEEDPAALVHAGGSVLSAESSLIDYNRSGNPLCELVTLPDIESPEEAREFMKTLIGILNYLEIFDPKRCTIKADANVSIKESGYVRAEIKNIGSFSDIEKALKYEIERQKEAAAKGEKFVVETRGWDSDTGTTYSMRTKESEADYGYIIDTDLPVIETFDVKIPKMPVEFAREVAEKHKVSFEDAYIIANQKAFGKIYQEAVKIDAKKATNWFRHVVPTSYVAKYGDIMLVDDDKVYSDKILELFKLFMDKKVSDKIMKEILEKLVEEDFSPSEYIKSQGLEMVSDSGELEGFCNEAISENPAAVEDFKGGEPKSLNFLVGQVMKKSKGKANPGEVSKILQSLLK
jgi:aspartyl-tRNA(Asn)/glutamyl-tRNA(Gln) amidotransferase subunit B